MQAFHPVSALDASKKGTKMNKFIRDWCFKR